MTSARNLHSEFPPRAPDTAPEPAVSSTSVWASTPLGQLLNTQERALLESIMPSMYRPVCAQVSGLDTGSALDLSAGGVSFFISGSSFDPDTDVLTARARADALPFAARSVDLMILSHVLEFSDKPHEILREVEQTMAPGGHIVLIGFNPLSLWGLRRLILKVSRKRKSRPWRGSWLTLARIKDWVRLLGLESSGGRIGVYGIPIQSEGLNQRFAFLERVGARWWPRFGAVYAVVVVKREMSATPLKAEFRRKTRLSPGLVMPLSQGRSNRSK